MPRRFAMAAFATALIPLLAGCASWPAIPSQNPFRTGDPYRVWDNERADIDA